MLVRYLNRLGHWLTFHALYQWAMEGSTEMQDGICTHFDNLISGAATEQSPQQHMKVQHSKPLRVITELLEKNRLRQLRAYFREHPTNTF